LSLLFTVHVGVSGILQVKT